MGGLSEAGISATADSQTYLAVYTPTLAYALVLIRIKSCDRDFKRVELAEVNYKWIRDSVNTTNRFL